MSCVRAVKACDSYLLRDGAQHGLGPPLVHVAANDRLVLLHVLAIRNKWYQKGQSRPRDVATHLAGPVNSDLTERLPQLPAQGFQRSEGPVNTGGLLKEVGLRRHSLPVRAFGFKRNSAANPIPVQNECAVAHDGKHEGRHQGQKLVAPAHQRRDKSAGGRNRSGTIPIHRSC